MSTEDRSFERFDERDVEDVEVRNPRFLVLSIDGNRVAVALAAVDVIGMGQDDRAVIRFRSERRDLMVDQSFDAVVDALGAVAPREEEETAGP
jgi:hypothetical protein